ncbi:hypothetical protein [Phenylobacterium sp.]|uniref:hypothetical protein n=1 Tax=Phenylobacterium sp. TaxID=1871053 RepID=UPI002734BEB9|nr:hypothetical protein [Phenylobacterium sp.]MDP3853606.1 hypothetical protein [Phenylobacterium sp.]
MKLPLIAALAACLLSACSPLSRAMVPDLGQLEVRVKPKITCSSVAQRVAAAGPLEAAQIFALFGACEESQAGTMVDLQAGRDVGLPLVPN